MTKKVFVFGIDGAMPEKIFNDWLDELPNIKRLMNNGCYAKINSTIPPVSVVAWTSMTTGLPPAEHGIFECLSRRNHSYELTKLANSNEVNGRRIWEIASDSGKKSIVCLVPLTWPIKPFNGSLVSGFMAPLSPGADIAYPPELKEEINTLFGGKFLIDIDNYRNLTKEDLLEKIYNVTEMHLTLLKHIVKNREWDMFFASITGSDRINHGFWKYCDENHRKYDPDSKFRNALKDYYKFLDKNLGEMLEMLDEDTTVIVVSDHGITRMHNRVNLTDWLIKEKYMTLKKGVEIKEPCKFEASMVDWEKTKVFAMGAFDGQIFVNLKGRESSGVVSEDEYDSLVDELEERLKQIEGDDGSALNTKIFKKKDYLKGANEHIAPDLIVYFDDLEYGCNTSRIGNPTLWSPQTAVGSDDAGHSRQGIFIINKCKKKGNLGEVEILDIAPTILNRLGVPIPEEMKGEIID